ncbi:hypothetical protein ONZ45_g13187 [Pleurotus djamor]|nr:hypothetical protein ONZ45_g13187 [Pleurotus djamor]
MLSGTLVAHTVAVASGHPPPIAPYSSTLETAAYNLSTPVDDDDGDDGEPMPGLPSLSQVTLAARAEQDPHTLLLVPRHAERGQPNDRTVEEIFKLEVGPARYKSKLVPLL